jgi:glycosyltransferase involved in cell wall biosynthesis
LRLILKKVSVIISNRNDLAMLSVTVASALEELSPFGDQGEIVICDNSDKDIHAKIPSFIPTGYIPDKIRVYRQDFPCLFTARETAAWKAEGEYILCVDSHMILGHNMIVDLVNFMDRRKKDETLGFAHAPIRWTHHHERNSRHDRDMSINELGDWGKAYKIERTITWKGIPWICRRDWFLDKGVGLGGYGALSQHRLSWGGGDMHLGVKPWLLGFKNWAVPTRPAVHIGPFPNYDVTKDGNSSKIANGDGYRYRLYYSSGNGPHTIGFLVSCYVLGGESMMKRNAPAVSKRFGQYIDIQKFWKPAIEYGKDEKAWLDTRRVMTFDELLEKRPWNLPTQ